MPKSGDDWLDNREKESNGAKLSRALLKTLKTE